MDDQHGNVIDGTERAQQWRPRPKTGSTPQDREARSDAPKSFAGSLLVPADMLPQRPPDEQINGNEQRQAPPLRSDLNADPAGETPAANGAHQNPFLVPEAAHVEHRARSARSLLAALLGASGRLLGPRRMASGHPRRSAALLQWMIERRTGGLSVLAVLTGAVLVTVIVTTQPRATHHSSPPALGADSPVNLDKPGGLTALSNPFAQRTAAHHRASRRARQTHPNRTPGTHRRSRAVRKAKVVRVRHASPASDTGSPTSTSTTPSYASAAPAAGAPQQTSPTGSATTSSGSTSAGSRPAFGELGTLGPGRGGPGTQ